MLLMLSLAMSPFLHSAEAGESRNSNGLDVLTIEGIGYPPIKAQSEAQAHLMAKRAAIMAAYKNTLAATGSREYEDDALYSGLSGFVKDFKVIKEEYLKDGGVKILISVPVKSIRVPSKTAYTKSTAAILGPLSVTLDEWYKIIRDLVRIEK